MIYYQALTARCSVQRAVILFCLFFRRFHLVYQELGGVVGFEIQIQQHTDGCDAAESCQPLADPERPKVQAVHPQALDPHSAKTVPGSIAQGDLAVILPALGQEVEQYKSAEIPQGFIQ